MTGIIAEVGSRSGIIGITELDYEEGTFSPEIGDASNNAVSYSTRDGNYVKVGSLVFVVFELQASDLGSVGDVTIRNMPFTSVNLTGYFTGSFVAVFMKAACSNVRMQMNYNATFIDLMKDNFGTGTHAALTTSTDVDTGTLIRGSLVYRSA